MALMQQRSVAGQRVGLNGPTCIGWLVAEEQEALVDFNIVLPFDVGGFEFVHGFGVSW
jgi:hypothetical protein